MAEENTNAIDTANSDGQEQEVENNSGNGDGGQNTPEKVELTQEELDTLINKAFAKGARAATKENAPKPEEPKTEVDPKIAEAEKKMDTARRMCENSALLTAAVKANFIDPQDALALADRSDLDMDDEGNVDGAEDSIKALIKAKPHLVKPKETPPPYASGAGKDPIFGQPEDDEFQKRINKYKRR